MQEGEKRKIRKAVLTVRNALAKEDIEKMSASICARVARLKQVEESASLMIFLSFGSEVDTDPIIEWAWQRNKRVLAPLCKPETREMTVYAIKTFADVAPGYFGIREPRGDILMPVAKEEIDLVAVPAVAFDRRGYRVGYGGGYYDRFLADWDVPTIGLAFSCQIIPEVPIDRYDQPVQGILTEKEYIDTGHHYKNHD
ncbi:MAG: 5-formyltetrahydrofolate cyclo-ligase [Syntrophales bacterium LBB04]|nr:5-formyltetrahydrofolate cyclo-ligase [Syntrophales bacterium LBB04]